MAFTSSIAPASSPEVAMERWGTSVARSASARSNPVRAAALPIESTASPWHGRHPPRRLRSHRPAWRGWDRRSLSGDGHEAEASSRHQDPPIISRRRSRPPGPLPARSGSPGLAESSDYPPKIHRERTGAMVMASPVLCTAWRSSSDWYSCHQASALALSQGSMAHASSRRRSSAALCGRRSGSLSRQASTTASSSAGIADPSRRQRLRLLVEMLAAHLDDRLAVEDVDPREQIVSDRAHGVDVRAGVDRVGRREWIPEPCTAACRRRCWRRSA